MKCTPLAVESYGRWGSEARQVFSHLASRLSFGLGIQKPKILVEMHGQLNIVLVRCNARALYSRACNLVLLLYMYSLVVLRYMYSCILVFSAVYVLIIIIIPNSLKMVARYRHVWW